jgi:hypothetical protein
VLGRSEPEPQGWLSIFNFLPGEKSFIGGIIAFCVAAFFILMCVVLAPEIAFFPAKFAMCFTFAMIALIAGMALLAGPRLYVKKLFIDRNLWATVFLLFSIVMAVWFSVIKESYLMSLLFCVCELNAVAFFFCNTSVITLG